MMALYHVIYDMRIKLTFGVSDPYLPIHRIYTHIYGED